MLILYFNTFRQPLNIKISIKNIVALKLSVLYPTRIELRITFFCFYYRKKLCHALNK